MNGNGGQRTLMHQKFGVRAPEAWVNEQAPIIVFWLDGEPSESVGLPFWSLQAARYISDKNLVSLEWPFGSIIAKGPKAKELYLAFARNRATEIRADGVGIESVTFVVPEPPAE